MGNHQRAQLRSADQAFRGQDYGTAEMLLLELLEDDKSFADAYMLLGMIQYRQGRFSQAIASLEQAVRINPNYCEALMYLSVIYHDLGQYEQGKAHIATLTALPKLSGSQRIASPFSARLANMHADTGDLYRSLGCYTEAKADYERALALEPKYADIRLKRALCLRELAKDTPLALKEIAKDIAAIITDNPRYKDAHFELGITYYLLGDLKSAQAAWSKLIKIDPGHPQAAVYLKLIEKKSATSTAIKSAAKHASKPATKKIPPVKKKTQPSKKGAEKKLSKQKSAKKKR